MRCYIENVNRTEIKYEVTRQQCTCNRMCILLHKIILRSVLIKLICSTKNLTKLIRNQHDNVGLAFLIDSAMAL
nr:AlNc14C119G6628 [Albugo laibachii Nc14]CCA26616.1 AlNc14C395G11319 [Albugo laibachii Nc14]|eukprot:CCA26616.1 AlNc14C395G11319 [Albugo laibachii Nc14]